MRGRRLPTALPLGYGVGDTGIVHVLDAQRLQQLTELSLVQAGAQRYACQAIWFSRPAAA